MPGGAEWARSQGLVPQSGDWDHPVRWVKPGDPGPEEREAGISLHPDSFLSSNDEISAAAEELGVPDWRRLIKSAFSVGVPGYDTFIDELEAGENWRGEPFIRVGVTLLHEGQRAGMLERTISLNTVGEPYVHHDSFFIDAEHRNKGIAADMLDRAEEAYMRAGLKEIRLMANDAVGGYAWARQGFDFADPEGLANLYVDARHVLEQYSEETGADLAELEHEFYEFVADSAPSIAAWNPGDDEPGEHLGKRILLGSGWDAVKRLDPEDLGYQIGLAYRALRRQHAGR